MRQQKVKPILIFLDLDPGQNPLFQQSLDQCLMPPRPFAAAK